MFYLRDLKLSARILIILAGLSTTLPAQAVQLVSDEAIKIQKDLTSRHQLKNGIPVIIREIPNSDIVALNVSFGTGLKDLPPGQKALNEWMWDALTQGSKNYPKAKVFETVAKYALELACSGGIEMSACGLGTLNEHWTYALPLLADLIRQPAFAAEDVKLTKDRRVASLKNAPSDPGQYINEIINSIYYPVGHPYRLNHDEALKELEQLDRQDLVDQHQKVLNAALMQIVVVTSMPAKQVIADLEKAFGSITATKAELVTVQTPAFDPKQAYAFHDRTLPTAYIRIKLDGPAAADKDAIAAKLLYEILSEELGEEIRTKRSLSYAVHAFLIQYSVGVGVISASTSKPQETIAAIHQVIEALKTKTYSTEELEEYKRTFATNYFLTLETHSSLAGALASSLFFYGTTDELYDMPRKLDAVSAADVKRLANTTLNDLRVGIIFGRQEFKDEWALDLIKKNINSKANAEESGEKKSH